jgi:hypothetical protein
MKAVTVLAAAMLITGCSAVHDPLDWTKGAATMQQLTADDVDCEREARDAGYTPDLIVGGVADIVRYTIEESQRKASYDRCMHARGYERRA